MVSLFLFFRSRQNFPFWIAKSDLQCSLKAYTLVNYGMMKPIRFSEKREKDAEQAYITLRNWGNCCI